MPMRWLGLTACALAVGLAAPVEAQRNVTLRLNTASIPDTVDVNDLMEIRGAIGGTAPTTLPDGNVIDWNNSSTLEPTNVGGDYWQLSFVIPDDQEMQFKFWAGEDQDTGLQTNDGGWETGGNWSIPAGTGDVDREVHYFNTVGASDYDWDLFTPSGADSVAVWFRVYAFTDELSIGPDGFDPNDADDFSMSIRGNDALGGSQDGGATTIDWGASNIELDRESGTVGETGFYIYSGRVAFPNTAVGQGQAYKFYAQSASNSALSGWEEGLDETEYDGNRGFVIPAQDTTIFLAYYGDAAPVSAPSFTQTVVFQVDAQPLSDVGIFSRSRGDSLEVRGEFNDWGCSNPDLCELTRAERLGGLRTRHQLYRAGRGRNPVQVLRRSGDSLRHASAGRHRQLRLRGAAGQRRRRPELLRSIRAVTNFLGPEFFNNIRAGNVIPASASAVNVTFSVNMANALSFSEDAFDPAEDEVYVSFGDRLWQLTQGYAPDELTGGIDPSFTLSDPDGDNVYTGTYAVQTPTYNGIGYSYAYGDAAADDLVTDGQGGFDPCRRRYRYILPSGGGFPSSFAFARDVFRSSDTDNPSASLTPFEANPTDPNRDALIGTDAGNEGCLVLASGQADPFATAVEETAGEVAEVAKATAFPNPVAGTATIQYDVPQAGAVSLRVYDLVGREVAVLVDGEQAAAKYNATFEASSLAPGVYVYRLLAAGQVVSGKLTVVR